MPRKSRSKLTSRKGRDSRGRLQKRTVKAPATVVEGTSIAEIKSEPLSTDLPATPALQTAGSISTQSTSSAKRPRLSRSGASLSLPAPKPSYHFSIQRLPVLDAIADNYLRNTLVSSVTSHRLSTLNNNIENMAIQEAVQRERAQPRQLPSFLAAAIRTDVQMHNLGEMNRMCDFCKAKYFNWEVSTRNSYSKCCNNGEVKLPPLQPVPQLLRNLFQLNDERSSNFKKNILQYNNAFQFITSKTHLQDFPSRGSFVYVIRGNIHYYSTNINVTNIKDLGSVYFLSQSQALKQRLHNDNKKILDHVVLRLIAGALQTVNPFAAGYRHLRMIYDEESQQRQAGSVLLQLVLEFINYRSRPLQEGMINEVAAVYRNVNISTGQNLRIFLQNCQENLQFVSYENPNIDALVFPLLFPRGDPGYIFNKDFNENVNPCQYYMYRLAYRNNFQIFYHGGLLTQAYIVHAYIKIETDRLRHLGNQDRIRAEEYMGLADYLHHREVTDGNSSMVILPSSFAGSARSQQQLFQDALAIVSKYDNPSLFITFSCNLKWPAIINNIPRGENPFNHPMLIVRVFHQMLHAFIDDIVTAKIFGVSVAQHFVVKFQENGLPLAYILTVFRKENKLLDSYRVDQLISAEIPDPADEPELYELVATHMIHGPCGVHNLDSQCMEKEHCIKNYPKPLVADTVVQNTGCVIYRRRINDRHIIVRLNNTDIKLNNSWVIPYNPHSLLKYRCHVSVEACASEETIKYLHKYFFKTPDDSLVQIFKENGQIQYSEVETYLNRRYMSSPEASWHINQYSMYKSMPTVIRLPVHLPKRRKTNEVTQLTGWFRLNREEPEATTLLYEEVPQKYVWKDRAWVKRARGAERTVRVFTVSVDFKKLFYLRLLLLHVRGATCFQDLRTVDGEVCPNYGEACRRRNLLAVNSEWHRCIAEAVQRHMPREIRQLYAYIVMFCKVNNALELWTEFKTSFIEDFSREGIEEDMAEQWALCEIQEILRVHERGIEGLQLPLREHVDNLLNRFDMNAERDLGKHLCAQLNRDQCHIYETVVAAVRDENAPDRLFYLDGPSGSGKTFLFNTIISSLLGDGIIVLSVACTDLAASLLKGGKTVNSQFKLPIPVVDESISELKPNTLESNFVINAKIIIWDEINMATRFEFERVNSTLRFLCESHLPFGGKVVLLGGDFRLGLPTVHNGHRLAVMDTCVKSSHLWLNFTVLHLHTNVRTDDDQQAFSQWLLELGNDTLPHVWVGNRDYMELPQKCLVSSVDKLICSCFENVHQEKLFNKTILTPLHKDCHVINDQIVSTLPGEARVYYSANSIDNDNDYRVQLANYPIEFLNNLLPVGMPRHRLTLKVGALIALIQNLNVHRNLCSGTRLIICQLGTNYIDAERIEANGDLTGERVFIPRIDFSTVDDTLPFKLRRRQFPVRLAYAMTIDNAQGQTFESVGIYLPNTVFSHGQLYMAFSRARRLDSVFVCAEDTPQQGNLKGDDLKLTKNIVYTEIL